MRLHICIFKPQFGNVRPDVTHIASAQLHAVLRYRLISGKAASRPRLSDALLARIRTTCFDMCSTH